MIKRLFAVLLSASFTMSVPAQAGPLEDFISNALDYPSLTREQFEAEITKLYGKQKDVFRLGPEDLPEAIPQDPLYWSMSAPSDARHERPADFFCTKKGTATVQAVLQTKIPHISVAERMIMQRDGKWPGPINTASWHEHLQPLPDDVVAQLDCSFRIVEESDLNFDYDEMTAFLATNFKRTVSKSFVDNARKFSNPARTFEAFDGPSNKHAKLVSAIIFDEDRRNDKHFKKDKFLIVIFSVWLLHTGS